MKFASLLILALLTGSVSAQLSPYVAGDLRVNGEGFSPISLVYGMGVREDSQHVISEVGATYQGIRKTNDNTGDNPKGRVRTASARTFYRFNNGFYIGGGAQWSKLNTSNYSKQSWRPTIGVGKDFIRPDWSLRLQGMYLAKGSDKVNGQQGAEVSLTYPSPNSQGHFFFKTTVIVTRFHTTDTFSDPATSALQNAEHHFGGGYSMGLIYRFRR